MSSLGYYRGENYGETDVVTNFSLRNSGTGRVITLGTLSLEQTTPGMRSWFSIPKDIYNVNGRLNCTDLDVRLSTAYAINGYVVEIPISDKPKPEDLRFRNFGRITTRSNVAIVESLAFHHERTIDCPAGNSLSDSAERAVFDKWISGEATNSDLSSHLPSMTLLQALAESVSKNGERITIDFSCPA